MQTISLEWHFTPQKIDLIVLNTPGIERVYEEIYQKADKVILADGASNLISQFIEDTKKPLMPTHIVGDMDSITEETKQFFSDVPQIVDTNQDRSDLDKTLAEAYSETIVILGEYSGRADHLFKVFSCLCQYKEQDKQVFYLSSENLIFLVNGDEEVFLYDYTHWNYYGLVPINGPALASTRGFKWDLNHQLIRMGGLISSSNKAIGNRIRVQTTEVLMFICSK